MKKYTLGILVSILCNPAFADMNDHDATVKLTNQQGQLIGNVSFSQEKNHVRVKANVSGLTPGFHGFHVHTIGQCTVVITTPPTAPFASAGGHFKLNNATTHKDHSGDFPVLLAKTNGKAKIVFSTDRFKVQDLFDPDGSAVVIHANPDNYANIPTGYTPSSQAVTDATLATGDAGGRIACGVVKGPVKLHHTKQLD